MFFVIRFKFKFKTFKIATFKIKSIIVSIIFANLALTIISFKKLISNYEKNT